MALTEKDFEVLARPFDKKLVKSFQGKGGKTMRYLDVEVVEARLAEVDDNFSKEVTPGARAVAVHYTLKGTRRGDLFDNDSETNKYGAPQVNALARASRRAARLFGVAKDLWEDEDVDVDDEDEDEDEKPVRKSSNKFTKPVTFSAGQVKILKEKGFTSAEIKTLTSWKIVQESMDLSERGEALSKRDKAKLLAKYAVPSKAAAVEEDEDDYEEDEE